MRMLAKDMIQYYFWRAFCVVCRALVEDVIWAVFIFFFPSRKRNVITSEEGPRRYVISEMIDSSEQNTLSRLYSTRLSAYSYMVSVSGSAGLLGSFSSEPSSATRSRLLVVEFSVVSTAVLFP